MHTQHSHKIEAQWFPWDDITQTGTFSYRHIYQGKKLTNKKRLLGGKSIRNQLETSLQVKQKLERLTHPSCTLRTASSFSRCTNSLLPVEKKNLYILLWQFSRPRSFALSVNLHRIRTVFNLSHVQFSSLCHWHHRIYTTTDCFQTGFSPSSSRMFF